jgi:hypothetical protein
MTLDEGGNISSRGGTSKKAFFENSGMEAGPETLRTETDSHPAQSGSTDAQSAKPGSHAVVLMTGVVARRQGDHQHA